jgi:LAO/AO transport system kinase
MPASSLHHRRRLPLERYTEGILRGDRVILARAITVVESDLPADGELAARMLDAILPATGKSRRVGITGVPGVGKSTFIDALGMHLIRQRGERVAVLSVDPSSPISGGSILGDKTRMERLSVEERAFIRPSPARGHLGGVARRTRETILLCEAAGFENVLVETVGVGQSETAVRSMTDFFLLLMLAGAGDELQGIKRGIIEMIDGMVINKADGDNKRKPNARAWNTRARCTCSPLRPMAGRRACSPVRPSRARAWPRAGTWCWITAGKWKPPATWLRGAAGRRSNGCASWSELRSKILSAVTRPWRRGCRAWKRPSAAGR